MANENQVSGDSLRPRATLNLKRVHQQGDSSGPVTSDATSHTVGTHKPSRGRPLAEDFAKDTNGDDARRAELTLKKPAFDPRLDERLMNWGNVERGRASAGDRIDAVLVGEAWRCLNPLHKEMLRMHYVWRAHREVICRRLKIQRRPETVFELELARAKRALRERLSV